MEKLGVALAGGGSRGAYQTGVWQAMRECGMEYQIVTGTSVGALNGAMMVQGDYEQARRMWGQLTARDVVNVELTGETGGDPLREVFVQFLKQAVLGGGVDVSGLEGIMRGVIDTARFFDSPIDYGLVTVKVPAFEPVTMAKREIPPEKLCDYLVASASCFPTFPAKAIGGEKFIDGAYYDNLPINLAVELGATRVIAVDLQAIGLKKRRREREAPVTRIAPTHPLGPTMFFEPDSAARNMRLGYLDGLRAFGRAEGEYIALRQGETAALGAQLAVAVEEALRLAGARAPKKGDWFGEALQRLAEWYELDVESLYTAQEYCYELLLRFNAAQAQVDADILDAFSRGRGGLVERLRKFSHQKLTAHQFARLREISFDRCEAGEWRRAAAVLRDESAAAVFLFALKRHLAGEA